MTASGTIVFKRIQISISADLASIKFEWLKHSNRLQYTVWVNAKTVVWVIGLIGITDNG